MSRSYARILGLAALAGAVAIAAAHAQETAGAKGSIVVYNAQHESLTREWAEGFTRDTGITVTMRKGSDMEFANQIVQEGSASPADVFVTENSPAMALVDKSGLFAPLSEETLAEVPAGFRPTNGHWIGVAARSTVFAYDKTRLTEKDLPASVMDLAKPDWQGRWAASPSGADFQAIVSAMLSLKGEDETLAWLKAMKANATPYKGNSTAMKAVNAGQIEGALIYHYYYFGDRAKTGENSRNVALHYFRKQDPGAFVSLSGAGVLKSSANPEAAEAFVKWIAGKGGQTILKNGTSFEYAVGKDAASNPALTPLADLEAPVVVPDTLDNAKVTDLMTEANLL
ncbi:iron ABC transporter substrate-binding protein [Aureimonas sp. SA4125]|uniref:iron ABC transporter substrate-binding protein n=1 Tax=Aureimonas sp. SA4125 TaxID=2826993 RepID=UPI001CC7E172|nr:iron ABC transporter substrate-binding protein [Aureimonas sp. SA4125]BDA86193.1 iron ABC transporter substrate-binding protein [Aureimonas sp. SA4125]